MPSKGVCDILDREGIKVYDNFFTANDSLETNQDLEALFEVLSSVRDHTGRSAVMTPLAIMGNPNFEAIRDNKFMEYVFEPFTETALKYTDSDRLLDLWRTGKAARLFVPEFHGREHLNVTRWMKGLQQGLPTTSRTFELGLTGLHAYIAKEDRGDYQAAFDIDDLNELGYLHDVLTEGVGLFQSMLGYQPRYFVPTNGPFNNSLEPFVKSLGIDYINSAKVQKEPIGGGRHRKRIRFLGQGRVSSSSLTCITRNVIFEPAKKDNPNWVDSALRDIDIAFKWGKPAIISSHRVNYVSRIDSSNRDFGLEQLSQLLNSIIMLWPDVEFMTSTELGSLITNKVK